MENSREIKSALNDYCILMENIKFRVDLVTDLARDVHGLPIFAVAELIYLQIRLVCETLAVACLVAHRNVEGARSNRLRNAYQADLIMNALEKMHARFYPRPIKQILRDGKPIGFEDIKHGFVTKDELLQSYRKAAEFLHAGDIEDFAMNKNKKKLLDLNAINAWVQKIVVLLNHHTIFLADAPNAWEGEEPLTFDGGEPAPKLQMVVQMATRDHGRPAATIFGSVGRMPGPVGQ